MASRGIFRHVISFDSSNKTATLRPALDFLASWKNPTKLPATHSPIALPDSPVDESNGASLRHPATPPPPPDTNYNASPTLQNNRHPHHQLCKDHRSLLPAGSLAQATPDPEPASEYHPIRSNAAATTYSAVPGTADCWTIRIGCCAPYSEGRSISVMPAFSFKNSYPSEPVDALS